MPFESYTWMIKFESEQCFISQLFSSVLFPEILFLISFISVNILYLIVSYMIYFHSYLCLRTFVSKLALIKYLTTVPAISFLIWFVGSVICFFSLWIFECTEKRSHDWVSFRLIYFLLNLAIISQRNVWNYSTFDMASHCCGHSFDHGTSLRDTVISDQGDGRSGMSYIYKHWDCFFLRYILACKGQFC